MAELNHECGVAAVYHLPDRGVSPLAPPQGVEHTSNLIPRLLLDIQNRGQLAAGMTTFNPHRNQLIDTHKDVGTVTEVFHLNHQESYRTLMREYAGRAAIGHVRYATCGKDDKSYAQPFERHHIEKPKWFSFAFNGQLANYPRLRDEILSENDFHLARETDTEVLMHMICHQLSGDRRPEMIEMLTELSLHFDGAYNIVYLNALGNMFVARDPLGIRPLCYAKEGPLFAAASESVALANLGFRESSIKSLHPGEAVIIRDGEFSIQQFTASPNRAHCFFEWIYFANVASTLDDQSVYLTRKRLGEELADVETLEIDEDTIVVPVPDTAKAAADSLAFQLKVPCLEGLIRNRYVGRTFIEGANRADKAKTKYTPLPEVLRGKKVLLVEDTIVRSTTMKVLVSQLKERGGASEVHVRVACPPIIAPCFYGIDMSTISELFAPKFMDNGPLTPEIEVTMAETLGADSLKYLPIEAISRCVGFPKESLCQACIDGKYPTPAGVQLYQIALEKLELGEEENDGRAYDAPLSVTART
ncbi:amidophosphoribosyltransferase [Symmachiella dynata]|uniref:amidophosphoribosyltransferase n=1 Tax=Symmachiella dynata TaxID=2527995 RepID=UPI0030EE415A